MTSGSVGCFEKFAGLYPENAFSYESIGDYYMAVKEFEKARDNYRKAYNLDNNLTSAKEKMESISAMTDKAE